MRLAVIHFIHGVDPDAMWADDCVRVEQSGGSVWQFTRGGQVVREYPGETVRCIDWINDAQERIRSQTLPIKWSAPEEPGSAA